MKLPFYRLLFWLAALLLPFFLILTAARLLITPLYAQIEYRMPWFPPDPYGLTFEDRLAYSRPSIEYLNNDEGIAFLARLTFPDGSRFFNQRELSHMVDVKALVKTSMRVWLIMAVFYLGLWLYGQKFARLTEYRRMLAAGGWWTIGFLLVLLLMVAVSFNWLFTFFHQIFFVDQTWIFFYDDSLIRLFPMVFWRDAFVYMGMLTIFLAGVLIVTGRKVMK